MPMKVNDWVVHPQHGVGRVVNVEARQFGSAAKQAYYEIAIPTGTLWVPADGSVRGLRRLTAKGELDRYRRLLRSRPSPLTQDHRERHLVLLERLREGSFRARCEVLRDLRAHSWHKPLNEKSGSLLRSAHHEVCTEWAAADGLSLAEATHEVEALLQKGKETYAG